MRPTFDQYFLSIAETVSTRSDCERSRVGAVVVKDRRIRATGYNGAPAGKPGCQECPRRTSGVVPGAPYDGTDSGRCVALHAELNAVVFCDREDLIGSTLYVTREPCNGCRKIIDAAGIARVVYPGMPPEKDPVTLAWEWIQQRNRELGFTEVVEDWHGKVNRNTP